LKSKEEFGAAIDEVDVVVWGESCHKFSRSPNDAGFKLITHRGKDAIFVRDK
jgi:hypothetical protein